MHQITQALAHFHPQLAQEIQSASTVAEVPANTEILREGQYVKVIPIVLAGLVKVFTRHEDKELLLYYIKPHQSCIMSLAAGLKNEPSNVVAQAEVTTRALLLPIERVAQWTRKFPDISTWFFHQHTLRYGELLSTIHHVLFDKMDKRLYDYLKEKVALTDERSLKITHRQIAHELGTAREVVSRVMKKLEAEGKVAQRPHGIEIRGW